MLKIYSDIKRGWAVSHRQGNNRYLLAFLTCALFFSSWHTYAQVEKSVDQNSLVQNVGREAPRSSSLKLINRYQGLIDQGKHEEALPLLQQAFNLASDGSLGPVLREKTATDYMLSLIELGRFEEALKVSLPLAERDKDDALRKKLNDNALPGLFASFVSPLSNPFLADSFGAVFDLFVNVDTKALRHNLLNRYKFNFLSAGEYRKALPFARAAYDGYGRVGAKFASTTNPEFYALYVPDKYALIGALNGVGREGEAMEVLELTSKYIEDGNTPGESYFNGQKRHFYPWYWTLKALMAARTDRIDEFERIAGARSELTPSLKHYARGYYEALNGFYKEADSNFLKAESLLRDKASEGYSLYSAWCGVKLILGGYAEAVQICSKALANQRMYRLGDVPRLIGKPAGDMSLPITLGHPALIDLVPPTWPTPPNLLLAVQMAAHYSGQETAFKKNLQIFVETEERERDRSIAINFEHSSDVARKSWAYKELARIYLSEGDLASSFRLQEMIKSRALLDAVNQRDAISATLLPESDRTPLAQAEIQLARYEERLGDVKITPDVKLKLESERDVLIREYRVLRNRIFAKHPRFAEIAESKIVDASHSRHLLPADTAFVSYLLHHDEVFVYALVDGELLAKSLGRYPSLYRDIQSAREALALPSDSSRGLALASAKMQQSSSSPMGRLSDFLLGNLPSSVMAKPNLVIAPEGVLSLLPFEVLEYENRRLVEERDVAYVQSLSMLATLQKRAERYGSLQDRAEFLGFGNPSYADAGSSSPLDRETSTELAARGQISRAFLRADIKWPPLPGTQSELKEISALFSGAEIYMGVGASERTMKNLSETKRLNKFKRLHFATHGYVNPANPGLNAIVLEQGEKDSENDGYLTAAELAGYELNSDLITLSACETGLGKVVEGEGVVGLPYALFMAGNVNTVMTLWSVADQSTSEFMSAFYSKMKSGQSISKALSSTKRDFMKREGVADPFFWAPFVLYGI